MINIVTALYCEAKPIINYYNLKKCSDDERFHIYVNEDINLIISGVGKIASAAASAYLYGFAGKVQNCAWLNIGVAGHRFLKLGVSVIANKITDKGSEKSWYPTLIFNTHCQKEALVTLDQPSTDYSDNVVYDMEASGFYSTVCRFSTTELIQCVKVVSDNAQQSASNLSAEKITHLVEEQIDIICDVLDRLGEIAKQQIAINARPKQFDRFITDWRFTATEKIRLERLLKMSYVLHVDQKLQSICKKKFNRSKDVICYLEKVVEKAVYNDLGAVTK